MNAAAIRATFDYDPETGVIERKDKSRKRRAYTGTVNGSRPGTPYVVLCVDHKKLYGHRVAWMHANGDIPDGMVIDHIDGNGLNNRLSNLRLVSRSINQRNRRLSKNNTSGIQGVMPRNRGFHVECASQYIGYSVDFFEACCMRKSAELRHGYLQRDQ